MGGNVTTITTSMTHSALQRRVIVGVDTHKDIHVAVAIDALGAQLGSGSFTADRAGYTALISWATSSL